MFFQTMQIDPQTSIRPAYYFHDWRYGSQLGSPSSTTLASNAWPWALTARTILFDLMAPIVPICNACYESLDDEEVEDC